MRTGPADPAFRAGRLAKAHQFASVAREALQLADEASDVGDAFGTLAVHAGIAAADVVCGARLGRYSKSENHNEAAALLGSADPGLVKHLRVLLRLKTAAGYSSTPVSASDLKRAERAMEALLRNAVAEA